MLPLRPARKCRVRQRLSVCGDCRAADGRIRLVNEFLDPLLKYTRFLSPTAMIPLAAIWLGIGEASKYFLIFWGTIFVVLINTIAGVMCTPKTHINAALCLDATEWSIFQMIILPSAVPHTVTGIRIALASAFISTVPAELLAADTGLGYLLQSSSLLLQTDRMFAALATISTNGFLADRLFRTIVNLMLGRYYIMQ